MTIEESFGSVIRNFRTEQDISQEKLALECGLDRTYISLLERGMRQPTLKTIIKLAAVLGVSASDIIEKSETLFSNENK